jgi:hypothetical protein
MGAKHSPGFGPLINPQWDESRLQPSVVELSMPAYRLSCQRPCTDYDRIRSLSEMLYHRVCISLQCVLYKICGVFSLELRSVFHYPHHILTASFKRKLQI